MAVPVFAKKLAGVLLLAVTTTAFADSVSINGVNYSCTNSCVVTISGSNVHVADCCGGQVTMRFNTPGTPKPGN